MREGSGTPWPERVADPPQPAPPDTVPPGLDESVIRLISAKKEEPAFLLEWRQNSASW